MENEFNRRIVEAEARKADAIQQSQISMEKLVDVIKQWKIYYTLNYIAGELYAIDNGEEPAKSPKKRQKRMADFMKLGKRERDIFLEKNDQKIADRLSDPIVMPLDKLLFDIRKHVTGEPPSAQEIAQVLAATGLVTSIDTLENIDKGGANSKEPTKSISCNSEDK